MSDDILELLRAFRADMAEPSAEAFALAQARIAAADARAERRRSPVPAALRGRLAVMVGVGVATGAAAAGILLATPWHHGPGAVAPAQAAMVLRRVAEVSAPHPGWIFHERTVTLTPGEPRLIRDTWRQDAAPYRFRAFSRWGDQSALEIGGTTKPASLFVYDRATEKLYRNPPQVPINSGRYEDQARALREQLAGKPVTPKGGHWKVEAKTSLEGRSVYKLALVMPPPMGYVGLTYYVDANTYVPVQIVTPTLGNSSTKQVTRVVVYEYLPPTAANTKLAEIRAQHPDALVTPGAQMPSALLARLGLR